MKGTIFGVTSNEISIFKDFKYGNSTAAEKSSLACKIVPFGITRVKRSVDNFLSVIKL